jgi:hypothetical protein
MSMVLLDAKGTEAWLQQTKNESAQGTYLPSLIVISRLEPVKHRVDRRDGWGWF